MPNHVTNRLELSGEPELVLAVIEDCRGEVTYPGEPEPVHREITFTKLKPRPPCLDVAAVSNVELVAEAMEPKCGRYGMAERALTFPWVVELGVTTLEGLIDHYKRKEPAVHEAAKRMVANFKEHGHIHWYGWNCEHWGTKWNAYGDGEWDNRGDVAEIQFETAWSPPTPWLAALSLKHPEVQIRDRWTDEGGPEGTMVYQAGELIEETDGMQAFDDEEDEE